MYRIIIIFLLIFTILSPVGVIAGSNDAVANYDVVEQEKEIRYDFAHKRIYQVDGHSMEHLQFHDEMLVDVVPVSNYKVGDIIAFECHKDECDGAYIKEIVKKKNGCFWVEGRKDIWEESGIKKQSMDSRTTYGWLCDDEIKTYGVVFGHKA